MRLDRFPLDLRNRGQCPLAIREFGLERLFTRVDSFLRRGDFRVELLPPGRLIGGGEFEFGSETGLFTK